jgi:hypothetical protein
MLNRLPPGCVAQYSISLWMTGVKAHPIGRGDDVLTSYDPQKSKTDHPGQIFCALQ